MATLGAVQSSPDLSTQLNPNNPQPNPKPTPLPSPNPTPLPTPENPPVVGDPSRELPAGANVQIFKAARTSDKEITIITKEGDRVTLSAKSASSLTLGTYNAQGKIGGGDSSASGTSVSASSEKSFSFSVEGDLNEQERKDIQKIIKGANKALKDLFKGNVDEALERTLKLGNLDSISSFSASLTVTRSVEISKPAAQTGAQELKVSGDQGAVDVLEEPAPEVTPVKVGLPQVRELVRDIKKAIEDSGLKPEEFKNPFKDVFKSLLEDLKGRGEEQDSPKFKLAQAIRQNVSDFLGKVTS